MCLLLALCACRANVGPRSLIRGADVRFSNASCSEQIYGSAVAGNPSHAPLRDGTCGFYANSDIQTGLPLPRIASNNQQQCCQVCQNDPKCDGAVQAWGYCYPKTNIAMATVAKDQNTAILMYVPKTSFVAYAEADNPGDPLSTVENCSMQDCADECEEDFRCSGAVFSSSSSSCTLKQNVDVSKNTPSSGNVVVVPRHVRPRPPQCAPGQKSYLYPCITWSPNFPESRSPASCPNSEQILESVMPRSDLRRKALAWTIQLWECTTPSLQKRCLKAGDIAATTLYRRTLAMYAPDFLHRDSSIPVLFIIGWQVVVASDWPNPIDGRINPEQAWACFDKVTDNNLDMTQLEEPLLRRGWVLVYLYPGTCCDDKGMCITGGNNRDWSFAEDSTSTQFYPLGAKYGTEQNPSADRCYMKSLFNLNTDDSVFHKIRVLLQDAAPAGSRQYDANDYLTGCSICGFSSSGTMVSRLLQEQLISAKRTNPEAHIPPFQAAIIDAGGTYLCYNNPRNATVNPVCGTPPHVGTDCNGSSFPTGNPLPDITDVAFQTQCTIFGKTSIDKGGQGGLNAQACGASAFANGCCPALVAEDEWATMNRPTWRQCHAKVLVQQMSLESWSYQYSAYFYAWMLRSKGVETALLQCPGWGHGASWNCDKTPRSVILCLDVFWLDYWGRSEGYRKSRGSQSETELAQVVTLQYFPASNYCKELFPGAEKINCTNNGAAITNAQDCNLHGCCWEDNTCWFAAKPFGLELSLPNPCCTWDNQGSECATTPQ